MSAAEDVARAYVERLDVQAGDIVLVIVPTDWSYERMGDVANSFDWLMEDRRATAFVVPDALTFKVVRA